MGGADNAITLVDIQFSIFTDKEDDGEEVSKILDILTDTLHWVELDVEGYDYIKMANTNITSILWFDNIWQATVDYELWLQKS